MPELSRLFFTRIVALPEALITAVWPTESQTLRIASDELLIFPPLDNITLTDPSAIILTDGSFAGVWLDEAEALPLLSQHCEWEIPSERPAFAQGAVAGVATKLWFENGRVLLIVPASMAAEFRERFS